MLTPVNSKILKRKNTNELEAVKSNDEIKLFQLPRDTGGGAREGTSGVPGR